ncbi:MAG: type II pantothenate kinase [Myxococcales bacterium]|nr:type II pantothenate kinase [Myxococcales bacterium]
MSILPFTAGIDAGATLCKVAFQDGTTLTTECYPTSELDRVRARLADWQPRRVVATGGAASRLGRFPQVSEFEAWSRGAPLLAARAGWTLSEPYLLVSLGTGTSILEISDGGYRRVGGTALGGGSIMGLGRLLLETASYQEIVELASRGDRRSVDLLVKDVYSGGDLPLPGELTAANFGKLDSNAPEDLAHAIMGLIGENVGLLCAGAARETQAASIMYCGSTLRDNPTLETILMGICGSFGVRGLIPAAGAYCGALGAAALAEE